MKSKLSLLLYVLGIALFASTLVFTQTDPKTVFFRVSVNDKKGNILDDLKREQFSIKENGSEQEISYFSNKDEPASVVILLDLSESIEPNRLRLNLKYAANFIDQSNSRNEYSIVGFGPEVTQLTDWKDGGMRITEALNKIAAAANGFEGNTSLYDAMMFGFEKFKSASHKKKIMLIFSDGQDNKSKEDSGDVRKALKRNDVVVYAIAILAGADTASMTGMQGQAFLDEMAGISGGRTYYPITVVEGDKVVELVTAAVKRQYVLGYVPKESPKKKDWRSVKIKASAADEKGKEKSLQVITREGYFVAEEKP